MKFVFYFLIVFAIVSCSSTDNVKNTVKHVTPFSDSIRYVGRIKHHHDSVEIYWSGTMIEVAFKGSSLKAWFRDEHGKNYFNVVIDGDSLRYFKLDSTRQYYTLASGLSEGEHRVQLFKRTEWTNGKTWFYGLDVEGGNLSALPEKNNRVIEFYGNSITAGYAIEDDTGGDSPDSIFTDNYYTYGAITARHFKADYYATVRSGIGILVSWFPMIMPEMYDRLDPTDSLSKWDFKKVTPQVVVINLLQNDSWLVKMPDHPSFKQRFGSTAPNDKQIIEAYLNFVTKIREEYPEAYIICALGSMDATKEGSPWPGYVKDAVTALNDNKILTHTFPYINKGGHPRVDDNRKMAESLIAFIEKNIQW